MASAITLHSVANVSQSGASREPTPTFAANKSASVDTAAALGAQRGGPSIRQYTNDHVNDAINERKR